MSKPELDRLREELEREQLKRDIAEARRAAKKAAADDEADALTKDIRACVAAARELHADGAKIVRINNFVVEYGTAPQAPLTAEAVAAAIAKDEPKPITDEDYVP